MIVHLRLEDHGAIQKDCIVLSDAKVVHHDAVRNGDGHAALHVSRGVSNLVSHMGGSLHVVAEEEEFACRQHGKMVIIGPTTLK